MVKKRKEYQRAYRAANKEKIKSYRETNKSRRLEGERKGNKHTKQL